MYNIELSCWKLAWCTGGSNKGISDAQQIWLGDDKTSHNYRRICQAWCKRDSSMTFPRIGQIWHKQ